MKLKIKTAKLVEDQYGKHIEITKVGLYDDQGKWIKWTKLNQALLEMITNAEIEVHLEQNQ